MISLNRTTEEKNLPWPEERLGVHSGASFTAPYHLIRPLILPPQSGAPQYGPREGRGTGYQGNTTRGVFGEQEVTRVLRWSCKEPP